MFRLTVPITKSKKKKNGNLLVKGVASGPAIDKDCERFDKQAIQNMVDGVNNTSIPIRLEHENKVYTQIGTWTKASLDEDYLVHVEGEIDTELSLGKDIETLMKRGMEMSLSVGGRVLEATYEYSKELDKTVRVYKDILLDEISIVKNPAYHDAELSLAKSVDWDKKKGIKKNAEEGVQYSTEAQKLVAIFKNMKQVDEKEFMEKSNDTKKSFSSWENLFEDVVKIHDKTVSSELSVEALQKYYYDDEEISYGGMSTMDMGIIIQIAKFLDEVEVPEEAPRPKAFDDMTYMDSIPEEAYIIMPNRNFVLPHHDTDLSVNKEFLSYALKSLFDERSHWSPKDYGIALNHLYYHLKEMSMLKSQVEETMKNNEEVKEDESPFSKEEIELFKHAHAFLNAPGSVARPSSNGEPLDDATLLQLAKAHESLLNNDASMADKIKKSEEVVNEVETKEEVTTKETPTTETTEEKVEEVVETTEETKEVVEEKVTETVVEEKVAEVTPVEEKVTEETPAPENPSAKEEEEPKVAALEADEVVVKMSKAEFAAWEAQNEKVVEVTTEESSEETTEDVEETTEESEEKVEEVVTKAEGMSQFNKAFEQVNKAVSELTSIVTDLKKSSDENASSITNVTNALETVSKYVTTRKSVASYQAIEKSFIAPTNTKKEGSLESTIEGYMESGLEFSEAYKKAKTDVINV